MTKEDVSLLSTHDTSMKPGDRVQVHAAGYLQGYGTITRIEGCSIRVRLDDGVTWGGDLANPPPAPAPGRSTPARPG